MFDQHAVPLSRSEARAAAIHPRGNTVPLATLPRGLDRNEQAASEAVESTTPLMNYDFASLFEVG